MTGDVEQTEVLVVGGGLVGLSAALLLAWQGVPVTLVERHAGSSPHPRAIGYTERTLELMRAVGLAEHIPQDPSSFQLRRARIESLAGTWFEESSWNPHEADAEAEVPQYSPVGPAAIAQDRLEPLLRQRAVELGADVRLRTELLGFEQDSGGVTTTLRCRDNGSDYSLRASYLIAADGAASAIREQVGITRRGRGHMKTVRSVLFAAPLEHYLASGVMQFEIDQPELQAFLTTYNDGRWVLMFTDDIERTDDQLHRAVTSAIGRSDIPIDIITTGLWDLGASVNDSFRCGRIFFAGDSAHALPPTRGGYGANTGIHDVHNLAWKIAAVLSGQSAPELLDTYDTERRPVAWARHQQIFARPDYQADAGGRVVIDPIVDDVAMELGQIYRSAAIMGAPADLPDALRPDQWAGQPGTRAPHLWLRQGQQRISSLDLLQRKWVLLTESDAWTDAVAEARTATGITMEMVVVGRDVAPENPEEFRSLYGLSAKGACVIRPDGIVAWRSATGPPQDGAFCRAVAQISCSTQHP
ncbi:MAG: FAD-dependent oxidoreductase [Mycobacterium sp.]